MLRGYVHKVKYPLVADQRAALDAWFDEHDVPKAERVVYTNFNELIRSLRKGDIVGLGGGLHILANTRNHMDLAVERIQKKGCEALDVTTGEETTGTGARMAFRAMRAISAETKFGNVKIAGKKGAAKKWESLHVKRNETREQASEILWNTDLTWHQADAELRKIGWTMTAARKELHKDGKLPERRAGRPPKQQD